MPTDCISYQESGFFSSIINDFLNQEDAVRPFYHRFPSIENFRAQIEEKKQDFSGDRSILVQQLHLQYQSVVPTDSTLLNIEKLQHANTFTVTTGHQLNLFTGPLYFLYKIVTAINLSKQLKERYPKFDFVPVYWMATEDHDFEEISFFNFKGRKFKWNRERAGAVGKLLTDGLQEFFNIFSAELGVSKNADEIRRLFSDAYLTGKNLTEATRFLVNELFGSYGLVIIDGHDRELKKLFLPQLRNELLHQNAHRAVLSTIESLRDYPIQVNPRKINLFYCTDKLRERIILDNGIYHVNNTEVTFTQEEILAEAEHFPERFSPNVILRPLYQETILPNLCYIGGGGELVYWLELKQLFDLERLTFPILMLRNSALLVTEKQVKKADRLNLQWREIFLPSDKFRKQKIHQLSKLQLDLTPQKGVLREQFRKLYELAAQTDKSFAGAVKAQEAKQLKGLEVLEKRLLKAEKRKHAEQLDRLASLHEELFPAGALQERFSNFSEFYLEYGHSLIPSLINGLDPFTKNFTIVTLQYGTTTIS